MKNIAVIGLNENLKIFNLTGAEKVFVIKNLKDAKNLIEKLIKEEFLIILVEKEIYNSITKTVLKYKTKQFPAIVCFQNNPEKDLTLNEIKTIVGDSLNI